MKKLHKKLAALLVLTVALLVVFAYAGCAAAKGDYGWAVPDAPSGGGDFVFVPDGGADDSDVSGEGESGEGGFEIPAGPQTPIAKQLTAAAWNDALNYDFWLGLFRKGVETEGQETRDAIFSDFAKAPRGLASADMHVIDVTCNGAPVVGAEVKLYNGNETVYTAVSDSAGRAYVFGAGTQVAAASGAFEASAAIADGVTKVELTDCGAYENELEIMLVVDTTGSMGDELSFLCKELAGVVTRISSSLDCKIRLGLLFYRDTTDQYLTRKFDFIDVSTPAGLDTAVKNIKAQKSDGGGDYPEAVDAALSEAVDMGWHTNSKTRLLFHVLDAPYHDDQANQSRFADAVKTAAQKGIRIIPVAASGLDTLGQYTMRSAALLTGGTYTFLTDDSGIGNSHELPAVGKYTVEYLSDLMVRLTKGYYTGTLEDPIDWRQSESVA